MSMFTHFTAVIVIPFFSHQFLHNGHAAEAVNKIMSMFTLVTAVIVIPFFPISSFILDMQ